MIQTPNSGAVLPHQITRALHVKALAHHGAVCTVGSAESVVAVDVRQLPGSEDSCMPKNTDLGLKDVCASFPRHHPNKKQRSIFQVMGDVQEFYLVCKPPGP